MKYTTILLDNWFNITNNEIFNGLLLKPEISLLSKKQCRLSARYHFGFTDAFCGVTIGCGKAGIIGININQDKEEFIDTLVHEVCHVWQWQNNLHLDHGFSYEYYMSKAKSIGLIN